MQLIEKEDISLKAQVRVKYFLQILFLSGPTEDTCKDLFHRPGKSFCKLLIQCDLMRV